MHAGPGSGLADAESPDVAGLCGGDRLNELGAWSDAAVVVVATDHRADRLHVEGGVVLVCPDVAELPRVVLGGVAPMPRRPPGQAVAVVGREHERAPVGSA